MATANTSNIQLAH